MAEYRLHGFAESGNSYKAALMLNVCGLDWEPVFVDFKNGETRSEKFRAEVNEQGEVPVLDHAGRRLTQSGVILTYLAERAGRFGGDSEDEKLEILRWMFFDNHKFTSYFATLRFMVGIQKAGEPAVIDFLRGRVQGAWGIVEKHLGGRAFLVGDAPTIADFSLAGYVYFREEADIDPAAFPQIDGWSKRIAALPGWAHPYDLMKKAFA